MSMKPNEDEKVNWFAVSAILVAFTVFVLFCLSWFVIYQVRPGEVGVMFNPLRSYQILDTEANAWVDTSVNPMEQDEGFHLKPPWAEIDKFNIKLQEFKVTTEEAEGSANLIESLTNEGLKVWIDLSVWYKIIPVDADNIRRTIGPEGIYQDRVESAVRSVVRDVISQHTAFDVYGEGKPVVEEEIETSLAIKLEVLHVTLHDVLLRKPQLPIVVSTAIEQKKQAEQEMLRMDYIVQKEILEKDRKVIEASAIAEANEIISGSLTDAYLRWYWIDNLDKHESVIYVPADGGLPILTRDVDKTGSQ